MCSPGGGASENSLIMYRRHQADYEGRREGSGPDSGGQLSSAISPVGAPRVKQITDCDTRGRSANRHLSFRTRREKERTRRLWNAFSSCEGSGTGSGSAERGGRDVMPAAAAPARVAPAHVQPSRPAGSFQLHEPRAQLRPWAQKSGREPWLSNSAQASLSSMKTMRACCS